MDAQTRISQDIEKLSADLAAISTELKNFADTASAATQSALGPLADRLDAIVATADEMVPAVASITPPPAGTQDTTP